MAWHDNGSGEWVYDAGTHIGPWPPPAPPTMPDNSTELDYLVTVVTGFSTLWDELADWADPWRDPDSGPQGEDRIRAAGADFTNPDYSWVSTSGSWAVAFGGSTHIRAWHGLLLSPLPLASFEDSSRIYRLVVETSPDGVTFTTVTTLQADASLTTTPYRIPDDGQHYYVRIFDDGPATSGVRNFTTTAGYDPIFPSSAATAAGYCIGTSGGGTSFVPPPGAHLYIVCYTNDPAVPPTMDATELFDASWIGTPGIGGGDGGGGDTGGGGDDPPPADTGPGYVHLELVSGSEVLRLDGVALNGRGVQAIAGATGLGLPPKQVSWIEGAGDGAVAHGRRTLARDIDLPLYILGDSRADLKQWTAKLARMLAAQCVLRFVDPDGTWATAVEHVGGGDYAYGSDTAGDRELSMAITLRAGDPYFSSATASSMSSVSGSVSVSNPGDAPAWPIWVMTGGTHLKVTSPRGEVLEWNGTMGTGPMTIDTRAGTVLNGLGSNLYAGLAPAPRFWALPGGSSTINVVANGSVTLHWYPRKWLVI